MKLSFRAFLLFVGFVLGTSAVQAAEAPTVPPAVPASQSQTAKEVVDREKVRAALAATASLNNAEKQRVIAVLRKQLPKKPAADRQAQRAASMQRWQQATPQEKQERQQREAEKWRSLSPAEQDYRRAQLVQRLKALPEADLTAVLGALK